MRIVDNVRPDRQTVMFSATFPRAMEALARRILAKPIEVQVGGRSVVCSDVEQHVVSHRCFIQNSLFKRHLVTLYQNMAHNQAPHISVTFLSYIVSHVCSCSL